jgi:hypothetical protein
VEKIRVLQDTPNTKMTCRRLKTLEPRESILVRSKERKDGRQQHDLLVTRETDLISDTMEGVNDAEEV